MSDLFRKLKENNREGSSNSPYSFQGGGHPFRDRPGAPTTTSRGTMVSPSHRVEVKRTSDGDRPPAYQPPSLKEEEYITEWEPPGLLEMLKDLGLRMLEVGLAAAGAEIAYFFQKRRLFTSEQRRRRDWR